MTLPSIAVITPCLNAAATIAECLDSVRSQDHPTVEHVVVDGGSTDGTRELLEAAERITWVSEPDGGRTEAANKGVEMSSGDVVAWLNADDRYAPGALKAVAEVFAAHPDVLWVTGYCRIVDAVGEEIRRGVTRYKNFLLRRWSLPLYLTQNFVSDPATFVRRDVLERIGPISSRWRWSHDYDLWLRVAALGPPYVMDQELAAFRMAPGSLSMTGFEEQFREHAEVARVHGDGHRAALAANSIVSRLIVAAYRARRLSGR